MEIDLDKTIKVLEWMQVYILGLGVGLFAYLGIIAIGVPHIFAALFYATFFYWIVRKEDER